LEQSKLLREERILGDTSNPTGKEQSNERQQLPTLQKLVRLRPFGIEFLRTTTRQSNSTPSTFIHRPHIRQPLQIRDEVCE
jgi:hypothetical protein